MLSSFFTIFYLLCPVSLTSLFPGGPPHFFLFLEPVRFFSHLSPFPPIFVHIPFFSSPTDDVFATSWFIRLALGFPTVPLPTYIVFSPLPSPFFWVMVSGFVSQKRPPRLVWYVSEPPPAFSGPSSTPLVMHGFFRFAPFFPRVVPFSEYYLRLRDYTNSVLGIPRQPRNSGSPPQPPTPAACSIFPPVALTLRF